ncbi:MAG: ribonuclease E/G [Lachnospiraceae bacterium]|nr:ribonuclease E/G [Lachnospiraceae bacterium]
MSRAIFTRPDRSEEVKLRSTQQGKLLLTKWQEKPLALLIRENRLLQVAVPDEHASKVGAIYLGKVKKVQKNIDACFVEIADKELVYLPFSKCKHPFLTNRSFDGRILEGDELLVQIERDALKTKQAAATTVITVTGRFAVFNTGSERTGISAKLTDEERERLRSFLLNHNLTDSRLHWPIPGIPGFPPYGAVIRTEASVVDEAILLQEIRGLLEQFTGLFTKALHSTCFTCLSSAKSPWESCLEQIPTLEYEEAVTDVVSLHEDLAAYFANREIPFRLYEDEAYPLSKLYGLDSKMENALSRRIWLKSGAYLIVDITEALTVFDVNSGKYELKKASTEAFYQINLEAAREIALQIRLRNLSGIILVDFINMEDTSYEEKLLEYMKQLIRQDKITTNVIDITPLGLMEITRKKVNKTLAEQFRKEVKP